jgi:putative ABC transport system permease protein
MRLPQFFARVKWDRERGEELESYLTIEIDDNLARGMSLEDARAAAQRKLGNNALIREEIYGMNTIDFLDTLIRDIRYALRALRRNSMFTAVTLLTLGVGIGANTAVFSVVNGILLKPLSYPNPDRLVAVTNSAPGAAGLASVSGDLKLSASMYFTYADQNRTFDALGVWNSASATVTGLAEPEQVRAVGVSDGTLEALGVPPEAGRWLSSDDQKPNGASRVVLGYGYWQRRFGGDRGVIGRNITVNAKPREIVGVMPRGFRFLNNESDLILPLALNRSGLRLPGFGFDCIGRLKSGVSIAEASADLATLVPVWMSSWPAAPGVNPLIYENWRISPLIHPLKNEAVGSIGNALWVVMGTIGVAMLIVCANVANLMLVRCESRQQELAVRTALGAGRARIVREMLVESGVLGILGGILGLAVGWGALQLLKALNPVSLPRLDEISIDGTSILFTLALSIFSGMFFGSIPALKYASSGISIALRGGGRTSSQSRERHRARNTLAVVQVALAMVLLVSAGLMIRTFQELHRVRPGFTAADQIQNVSILIPVPVEPSVERVVRMENDMVERLAAIPGVKAVGFASESPMQNEGVGWDAVRAEGQPEIGQDIPPMRLFRSVSPGVFQAEGTRLLAGRAYEWTDLYGVRPYVMISENLARELWGDPRAAVGKRLAASLPGSPWREVIGVVEDVRYNGVDQPAPAIVYWPAYRNNFYRGTSKDVLRGLTFAIRSERAGTENFLNQVNEAIWSVNPNLAIASVRTMQEVYNKSMARSTFTLVMLGIAGAIALLLGILGIYGVISYTASQRIRDLGIRLALGAQQGELLQMFVQQGLVLAAVGVAGGAVAAMMLMRLMKALLFAISPLDPLTYLVVALVLAASAGLSSYLPARRASQVDPVEALRTE